MMYETDEMKKIADNIEADYKAGHDVMARIDAYIEKFLIDCDKCKTKNVTRKHDCAALKKRNEDERNIKDYMDFI